MIKKVIFCLQASLLSATCATFIRTLEECMSLANQSLTPELRPPERVLLYFDSSFSHAHLETQTNAVGVFLFVWWQMKRSISHPGTYCFDRWGQIRAHRFSRCRRPWITITSFSLQRCKKNRIHVTGFIAVDTQSGEMGFSKLEHLFHLFDFNLLTEPLVK